jgi:hypothetical protein
MSLKWPKSPREIVLKLKLFSHKSSGVSVESLGVRGKAQGLSVQSPNKDAWTPWFQRTLTTTCIRFRLEGLGFRCRVPQHFSGTAAERMHSQKVLKTHTLVLKETGF